MINIAISDKSALLVTDRNTRRYFTGIDVAEGVVVVTKTQTVCFTDARYFSAAKVKLCSVGIQALLYTGLECVKE